MTSVLPTGIASVARSGALLAGALLASAPPVLAQPMPMRILEAVAIEQRLDERLPLDLAFRDSRGRDVTLASIFGLRPVLVVPVYYECPMLCQEVLRGLARGLKGIPFDVGIELDVVAISFDAGETPEVAAAKRREILELYGDRGSPAGWHFLTGEQAAIDRAMESIGFRYAYDDGRDEFAHASAVILATPDGRIARYFLGLDYAPRDLRLGVVEVSQGTVGGPVEALLLYCYHYDPLTGTYGVVIMNVLRLAGLVTVLLLGGFILVNVRRDRVRAATARGDAT